MATKGKVKWEVSIEDPTTDMVSGERIIMRRTVALRDDGKVITKLAIKAGPATRKVYDWKLAGKQTQAFAMSDPEKLRASLIRSGYRNS